MVSTIAKMNWLLKGYWSSILKVLMTEILKSVTNWFHNRTDEVSAFAETVRAGVGSPDQAKEAAGFVVNDARLQQLTTGNSPGVGDMAHSYLFMRQMQESSRFMALPPPLRIGGNAPVTGAPATTALSGGALLCVDPSASPQVDPQTLTCH